MSASLPSSEWLSILREASVEVATSALSLEPGELPADRPPPHVAAGAYLALIGQQDSLQIGLVADEASCQRLARALMQLPADEPDLAPAEVADAVCEIVNIVAGIVKRLVYGRVPVTLGLPIFIRGEVVKTDHVEVLAQPMQFGDVPASLVVVIPRTHSR